MPNPRSNAIACETWKSRNFNLLLVLNFNITIGNKQHNCF